MFIKIHLESNNKGEPDAGPNLEYRQLRDSYGDASARNNYGAGQDDVLCEHDGVAIDQSRLERCFRRHINSGRTAGNSIVVNSAEDMWLLVGCSLECGEGVGQICGGMKRISNILDCGGSWGEGGSDPEEHGHFHRIFATEHEKA